MSHSQESGGRRLDRRRFLTTAAIGGATIVGASALGGLDADAAFAEPMPTLDAAIPATFAEGRIVAVNRNVLDVAGSHGERHLVQLTNATSVWKLRTTTAEAIEVGDGLYARGAAMPDGTIAADAVWVNIVNVYVTIRGIARDRLHLQHGNAEVVGHIVPDTTTASYLGGALTADLSRTRIGQEAQVLGAWRPADGAIDIARVSLGH